MSDTDIILTMATIILPSYAGRKAYIFLVFKNPSYFTQTILRFVFSDVQIIVPEDGTKDEVYLIKTHMGNCTTIYYKCILSNVSGNKRHCEEANGSSFEVLTDLQLRFKCPVFWHE